MGLEEIKCIKNHETIIDETRLGLWSINIKFAHLSSLFLAMGFCVKALHLKSPEFQVAPLVSLPLPLLTQSCVTLAKNWGKNLRGPYKPHNKSWAVDTHNLQRTQVNPSIMCSLSTYRVFLCPHHQLGTFGNTREAWRTLSYWSSPHSLESKTLT